MPSNRVSINGQEHLSWEVPDSKMEAVITVLDAVGKRAGFEEQQGALERARMDHDLALFGKDESVGPTGEADEVEVDIDEGGNVVSKENRERRGGHQSSGPE